MAHAPDFFVLDDDDARRDQVRWMHDSLGLEPAFFGGLLGCTVQRFEAWRDDRGDLPAGALDLLGALWVLVQHLMSFGGAELSRARDLLTVAVDPSDSPLAPPWQGRTLRDYLVREGGAAIDRALGWVTALRTGDVHRPTLRVSTVSRPLLEAEPVPATG